MTFKRLACTFLLGLSSLAVAQLTPDKGTTTSTGTPSSQDDCGPAGCTGGISGSGGAGVRSVAPVVIRTEQTAGEGSSGSGEASGNNATGRSQSSTAPNRAAAQDVPDRESDFQVLVTDTLTHSLPVFGRDLFRNTGDFSAGPNISAPADYVVGPGDELRIRTSGKVDIDLRARVDSGGQIFIPQVGAVSVAGVRADQLHGVIERALSQQFRGFDLSVTLGQIRSIQIFVLGQAHKPGVYTISSLRTLVNALFASGGPSSTGTLRDIQLKRDGKVIAHFDIYKLLLSGDKTADMHLLPGDILYIPEVGPQIAIDGNVMRPAIYELQGPTTVEGVLQLAGGLSPVAGTARISIDRIEDHTRRVVGELAINGREKTVTVQAGDILRIYPVSSKIENAVTLRGSIGNPGRFPWHAGMRVSDLIVSRQSLLTRNYYNQQNALDVSTVANPFSAGTAAPAVTGTGTTTGSVSTSQAAAAATASTITTSTTPQEADLASHDTEINWNYAVIERLGPTDLTTHLVPFALGEAIDNPSSAENKTLEPGDVVVVYARKDLNLPSELRARFVRIDGEVKAPGVYRIEGNEDLRELVRRAGGLSPHSYLYAAQLTRTSVRIAEEAKLRSFVQRETLAALSPVNNTARLTSVTGGASASSDMTLKQAYIAALAGVQPTGRVVLQMKPEANTVEDVPAFALQDGDHFFVPPLPNTVDVMGSVFNQGALRFIDGGRTKDYLGAAGGSTREGDKSHEFIIRADGTLVSRERVHGFSGLHIYPGDTVVVPGRYKTPFSAAEFIALTQNLSTFALSAVAIALIR